MDPRSENRDVAMVWMLDASAVVRHGGEEIVLDVGTVMIVPQWLDHTYTWSPAGVSHQAYVIFESTPLPDRIQHRTLPATDVVPWLLGHVLWLEAHRPPAWRQYATRAFEYALTAFLSGHSDAERRIGFATSDAVSRVIDYVREVWGDLSYTRPISLDELATAARVSRQYLCRVFVREIGVGPVECFRLMQLKRAASYLDQTSLGIAEIAARTGYTDETAFSRAFKKAAGASPRAFRRDRALEFDLPLGVRRLVYSTLLS